MKEWIKPEIWSLNVQKTESTDSGHGLDSFFKEHYGDNAQQAQDAANANGGHVGS